MNSEQLSLEETMQQIEVAINQNPVPIYGLQVIYQFDISGEEEGTYQLHMQGGEARVVQGYESEPVCTLKMTVKNFYEFLTGNLGGTVAFMTGKLKIDGDISKAMKLETLLKEYNLDLE